MLIEKTNMCWVLSNGILFTLHALVVAPYNYYEYGKDLLRRYEFRHPVQLLIHDSDECDDGLSEKTDTILLR